MGTVHGRLLDPVCGRSLAQAEGWPTADYKRRRYFFCSETCRAAFLRQTERFRASEAARTGTLLKATGRVCWGVA